MAFRSPGILLNLCLAIVVAFVEGFVEVDALGESLQREVDLGKDHFLDAMLRTIADDLADCSTRHIAQVGFDLGEDDLQRALDLTEHDHFALRLGRFNLSDVGFGLGLACILSVQVDYGDLGFSMMPALIIDVSPHSGVNSI